MRFFVFAAVGGISIAVGSLAALAFTYENQGTSQPSASAQSNAAPTIGFGTMDPNSVLPPIGQSIPETGFDFGPGAFNNGMAMQPSRNDSIGPSWLYPPR